MRVTTNSINTFATLLKAGLWEDKVTPLSIEGTDLKEILRIAEEQTVVGLIAAGLEHTHGTDINPEDIYPFISRALYYERSNFAMNEFIAKLINQLRCKTIESILVKGQGVAQCYERPLWRACGDIDLLLNEDNYKKAKSFLLPKGRQLEEEDISRQHVGMVIDSWVVELHGTLHSRQLTRMNRVIDSVQGLVVNDNAVRIWNVFGTDVFLPSPNEDVFLIFAHILQHFYGGGIGLRQVCDMCRLIWKYHDSIDCGLLEARLKEAGVLSEWKVFASLAVHILGMPQEYMPLYSIKKTYLRKANRIFELIIKRGNFGHNRVNSYKKNNSIVIENAVSFWRYLLDTIDIITIFPKNSVYAFCRMIQNGVIRVVS